MTEKTYEPFQGFSQFSMFISAFRMAPACFTIEVLKMKPSLGPNSFITHYLVHYNL